MSERINGLGLNDVASIYVDDRDRFIVSLIVGYSDDEARSAEQAGALGLMVTQGPQQRSTVWSVYDRVTDTHSRFEQAELQDGLDLADDPDFQ
jgi:hypothetical protein